MSGFNTEHQIFRQVVREFVTKEITPHVDAWENEEHIPRKLFRDLGDLGFLGLEYPEEYGGASGDFWMSIVLAEEMARCRSGGVAFSIAVHTDMSSPWLHRLGTVSQKQNYLPKITSGRSVCALAITEPGAGSDMAAIETAAVRDGDQWILNGSKTFITNGVHGDLYFVAARTSDDHQNHRNLSQFLVDRNTPGISVTKKLEKTGMHSVDTAEILFHDVTIPADNLIGEVGRGFYQLVEGLQRERLIASVQSIAAAEQAIEDTVGYLSIRNAFGKKLSEFQALRHRLADIATSLEAARTLTYHAASMYDDGKECLKEVSMAKLFATEVANKVAYEGVQLHGGYGYMRETPIERFARDYRLWTIAAGSSEIMREIIAGKLFSK